MNLMNLFILAGFFVVGYVVVVLWPNENKMSDRWRQRALLSFHPSDLPQNGQRLAASPG
jgi:hypothetical protein